MVIAALNSACAGQIRPNPKKDTFAFTVAVNAGVLDIKKKDPHHKGTFDGGYANIKVRTKDDDLKMGWECPGKKIKIWVHSWENDEGKNPGRLSKKYYDENLPEPEYFEGDNAVEFPIAANNGHKGTGVYKYDIDCGGAKYDPVIIINR
jgi:hypothetical protein